MSKSVLHLVFTFTNNFYLHVYSDSYAHLGIQLKGNLNVLF